MAGLTRVAFSNLDKVLFPKAGIAKSKMIEYYIRVAPRMLKILHGRALSLKRNFSVTKEPLGVDAKGSDGMYVVQEHHARRLHYDLRLERDGVLKSWAVPKGIPESMGEKRLAIEVEDHPLEYGSFEGTIPEGQYGAGTVSIWDKGGYETIAWVGDMIEIMIRGERLKGRYVLTRFKKAGDKQWLLFKAREKVD